MKFIRWTLVASLVAFVATLALALAAHWSKGEADRAATEKQALQQTQADLEKTRAELERSVEKAQEQTEDLNDAVAKSKQYQENQRKQASRGVGLANGMMAAAAFKPAVAEYYLTEGKWPTANQDIGMPQPTSFKEKGVRSVSVLPGGKIQIEVDDLGKRAVVFLNASVNAAGQVTWTCVTPSIPDIARLVLPCTYKSR